MLKATQVCERPGGGNPPIPKQPLAALVIDNQVQLYQSTVFKCGLVFGPQKVEKNKKSIEAPRIGKETTRFSFTSKKFLSVGLVFRKKQSIDEPCIEERKTIRGKETLNKQPIDEPLMVAFNSGSCAA